MEPAFNNDSLHCFLPLPSASLCTCCFSPLPEIDQKREVMREEKKKHSQKCPKQLQWALETPGCDRCPKLTWSLIGFFRGSLEISPWRSLLYPSSISNAAPPDGHLEASPSQSHGFWVVNELIQFFRPSSQSPQNFFSWSLTLVTKKHTAFLRVCSACEKAALSQGNPLYHAVSRPSWSHSLSLILISGLGWTSHVTEMILWLSPLF